MQASTSQEPGASTLKTPLAEQGEWTKTDPVTPVNSSTNTTVTPSRQPFPRRLSLLHNDASSVSSTGADSNLARKTSLTGPRSLNLAPQSVSSGPETPRRGKRMSLQYIPSPSTSTSTVSNAPEASMSRQVSDGSKSHVSSTSDTDDWLVSDDDAGPSLHKSMAQRDSDRVETQFHDTGYREGITAGKLSTLQTGFDQGFNEVGAPIGRDLGTLRGRISALLSLVDPVGGEDGDGDDADGEVEAGEGRTRTRGGGAGAFRRGTARSHSTRPLLPLAHHRRISDVRPIVRALALELQAVSLAQVAPPDYDALEHELEHQTSDHSELPSSVMRETESQVEARRALLVNLERRLRNGSTVLNHTRDLLNCIALRERRCFELREELKQEELQLQRLRKAWQQAAHKELAYSSSSSHQRSLSSATSSSTESRVASSAAPLTAQGTAQGTASAAPVPTGVPQAAAEAWNSFSSKIPVTLKSQLTNLFDSLANIDMPPPPDSFERKQAANKATGATTTPTPISRTSGDMLKPGMTSSLSVLEEEGSDVGSVVLSPRSPHSPAVPDSQSVWPKTDNAEHAQLAALTKPKPKPMRAISDDSSMLGFHVNEQGIAVPTHGDSVGVEQGADSGTSQTRRTSVLGSLTNLSKQVESRLQPANSKVPAATVKGARDENTLQAGAGSGDTFATMFAKRFKEARENASDILREAEKKLGNAMTIDELLGATVSSTVPTEAGNAALSPRIQVDGRDHDDRISAEDSSSWYHAAGGRQSQQRKSTDSGRRSPAQGANAGSGIYGLFMQTIGQSDAPATAPAAISPKLSPKPDASPTLDWNWDTSSNHSTDKKDWDWDGNAKPAPSKPKGAKSATQSRNQPRAAALRTPST